MIKEAGGVKTKKAATIKDVQLYGIEFDREIFALACANMLIHKDGKTNLEQLDSRTQEACDWIKSKNITKVLMNPPFESKYGCLTIDRHRAAEQDCGNGCDRKADKQDSVLVFLPFGEHSVQNPAVHDLCGAADRKSCQRSGRRCESFSVNT